MRHVSELVGQRAPVSSRHATEFEVGYGMQPYYDDVEGAPQNSIIGGATLWVLQGKDEADYAGVARLSSSTCRRRKCRPTGTSTPAICRSRRRPTISAREQGFYAELIPARTSRTRTDHAERADGELEGPALRQLCADPRRSSTKRSRLVMTGDKTGPGSDLDAVVERGNELMREFEETNGSRLSLSRSITRYISGAASSRPEILSLMRIEPD
jgi:sn-glycerol 3-phosphate transport system substrate-binding protein